MRKLGSALALVPLVISAAAIAQDPAIRSLESAARMDPRDGGAAIELANAYARDGRTGQADGAYRRALALDNVMMETPTGSPVWSHEVATRALAGRQSLTAR